VQPELKSASRGDFREEANSKFRHMGSGEERLSGLEFGRAKVRGPRKSRPFPGDRKGKKPIVGTEINRVL